MSTALAPDAREARLPKWAQDELRRLRGLVSSLEGAMAERNASEEFAGSRAFEQRQIGNRLVDVPLSRYSTVGALLTRAGEARPFRVRLYVREVAGMGGVIDLNADGPLLIRPRSSNSLFITEDRT